MHKVMSNALCMPHTPLRLDVAFYRLDVPIPLHQVKGMADDLPGINPLENDEEQDEDEDSPSDGPRLGAGHHVTPRGIALLRDELKHLARVERPKIVEIVSWAAGNGDRSENGDYLYGKKRLREIDRRLRYLTKRIEAAVIVDPAQQPRRDQVFFGAKVTYINGKDQEITVCLVGADEADASAGLISYLSPIARAILGAQVGDVVELRTPGGRDSLEILSIFYP